ncbi:hypothetical protein KC331_g1518 [Hortaea werneckii]|uniref:Peptidase A1 domain-containing protein n=1 Tax=Hortaea werneckii TaxID=91943 RepID=A0A3M7CXN5_HORWE|nr:hypothetical protein KC331_g1518 [Hortaea werneckii]KAI7716693.1 hypothetical protein KC353_g5194 [Hortaea werneckii]RMY56771.1 hypothetical protein D0865_03485 [Hortaea werneckii]
MYYTLVPALLLPLLNTALPATDSKPSISWTPNQQQVVSFTGNSAVKFDNKAAGIGLGLPTRALQSAGPYSLLAYDNLGVVGITTEIAGLKPFSMPNVLGYDVEFAAQGQQTMRARYDDSITDFSKFMSLVLGLPSELELERGNSTMGRRIL